MWEVSVVTDRVLSFVITRRHLLFFYSYPQGIPDEPIETMLRRQGNDMVYELEMFLQECRRIFWLLQAYVAVGFSQLRWLFVVDVWQTCIIFYALLISVMIHLSGFIVHVKIAFDFELGSLMKSIFVELSTPCLAELSCLD